MVLCSNTIATSMRKNSQGKGSTTKVQESKRHYRKLTCPTKWKIGYPTKRGRTEIIVKWKAPFNVMWGGCFVEMGFPGFEEILFQRPCLTLKGAFHFTTSVIHFQRPCLTLKGAFHFTISVIHIPGTNYRTTVVEIVCFRDRYRPVRVKKTNTVFRNHFRINNLKLLFCSSCGPLIVYKRVQRNGRDSMYGCAIDTRAAK